MEIRKFGNLALLDFLSKSDFYIFHSDFFIFKSSFEKNKAVVLSKLKLLSYSVN